MRYLSIMDPLPKKEVRWDTTYAILRELAERGHEIWGTDTDCVWLSRLEFFAESYAIYPVSETKFHLGSPRCKRLRDFDAILIRKEPPFDMNYLYLTYLLEQITAQVSVTNHPRGIRNANEKLITLQFPKWIPDTLVTSSAEKICEFQDKIQDALVVKPLNLKQGQGVVLLKKNARPRLSLCRKWTQQGRRTVMAQRFLKTKKAQGDKRILVLNGEVLTAFERHCPARDFRANLTLGATFHPTHITPKERQMIAEMKDYLVKQGLHFVGLDVMMEKLIEINVTCPAGISVAQVLYSDSAPVRKWADFLEGLGSRKSRS
ncbi:MAG: hypothetical protein NC930_04800 [Candidatus Omnitrophica bacterium]|nr:hypothetical protein [Candidatus Omnitrophota bacterium]